MTPNAEDVLSAAHVLREVIRPLVERLEALEQITQALEQRPVGVIDAGIWTSDTTYRRGEAVTHHGGFWAAQRNTRREPADGNDDWRLCVSRGKAGREGPRGQPGPPCEACARMAS